MRIVTGVLWVIVALGGTATAKAALSRAARFPVIYETQDAPRRGTDSRIDFLGVNPIGGGLDYRLSGIDYTSAERRRSEFGGIARFIERPTFQTVDPFVLYLPPSGVNAWSDHDIRCVSQTVAPAATEINCTWLKNGAHYKALFSAKRGVEWFDADCKSGVCRYVLRTATGLWSRTMVDTLRRNRLIRKG